jgi:hypothetical protein
VALEEERKKCWEFYGHWTGQVFRLNGVVHGTYPLNALLAQVQTDISLTLYISESIIIIIIIIIIIHIPHLTAKIKQSHYRPVQA